MKWEDQLDACNSLLVQQELSTPLIGLQLQQVSDSNQHCNNMQLGLNLISYGGNIDFKHLLVATATQLKVLTVPVAPVKNWRHPAGPPISFSLLFKK